MEMLWIPAKFISSKRNSFCLVVNKQKIAEETPKEAEEAEAEVEAEAEASIDTSKQGIFFGECFQNCICYAFILGGEKSILGGKKCISF